MIANHCWIEFIENFGRGWFAEPRNRIQDMAEELDSFQTIDFGNILSLKLTATNVGALSLWVPKNPNFSFYEHLLFRV